MPHDEERKYEPREHIGSFQDDVYNHDVLDKYGILVNEVYFASEPATSSNFSAHMNIPHPVELSSVTVSFTAASTSGTLQIEKLTSGTTPGSGTDLLKTAFDLSGTVNTPVKKTGRDMNRGRQFKQTDRLGFVSGGTLTGLENLVITMYFFPLGQGSYIP